MNYLREKLTGLAQKGQGMVEYALILAFVVVVATITLSSRNGLGQAINNIFGNAASTLQ